MKKVVSVVTAPVRFVGRLLLKLLRKLRFLRLLGKPFVKLSRLRGKKLVIALVPLLIVVVAVVIVLKPEPDRAQEVRSTLDRFEAATREKDYQELCDSVLASELVERVRAELPCEVALKLGFDKRQNPRLEVLGVEVDGDRAVARVQTSAVDEVPSTDFLRLVRQDDDWRIASLSSDFGGSAAP